MAEADRRRLFFALWPSAEVAAALEDRQRSLDLRGRRMPRPRLHLTLLFLGDVPAAAVPDLLAGAGAIDDVPAFDLLLSRVGYFRGPGAAWLGPANPPAELLNLAGRLADLADACGLDVAARSFRPHVTLARRVARAPRRRRIEEPLRWRVAQFSLTQSMTGSDGPEYRDLGRWPLVGASME